MNWTRVRYYRGLFSWEVFGTLALSLCLWMFGLLVPSTFGLFGMTVPFALFFFHAMMGFVFTFGIGYIVVGQNINEDQAVEPSTSDSDPMRPAEYSMCGNSDFNMCFTAFA